MTEYRSLSGNDVIGIFFSLGGAGRRIRRRCQRPEIDFIRVLPATTGPLRGSIRRSRRRQRNEPLVYLRRGTVATTYCNDGRMAP